MSSASLRSNTGFLSISSSEDSSDQRSHRTSSESKKTSYSSSFFEHDIPNATSTPAPHSPTTDVRQLGQYYSSFQDFEQAGPPSQPSPNQRPAEYEDSTQEENRATLPNFGNDYSDHFLRTGVLPQAHIMNVSNPLVGYPRLQKLHELKTMHTAKHACKPFCANVSVEDMPEVLSDWASSGVVFDVVLVGGCFKTTPSLETLLALPVSQLTPKPSVALVWMPSHGLEVARQALSSWGFRRSEDITFLAMAKDSPFYPPQSDQDFIEKSSWHCLMGLKGTLRRSEHSDLINCNIDTDTIIESKFNRLNVIPENIYKVIENFALMSRRLHIVPGTGGEFLPVRPRPGWVIASPESLLDNFTVRGYLTDIKNKGTRVPIDHEIDSLRPKTPPRAKRNEK